MESRSEIRSQQVRQLREVALDFLITLGLNLTFLALIALVLWPFGKTMLALRLAKGYGVFWIITAITAVALDRIQRLFRVDTDTNSDTYVISNVSHSVLLLGGWSAFAVLTTHSLASDALIWLTVTLWFVGVASSFVAFAVLTAFYRGSVYRVVNISMSLVSFFVFAMWPASARSIYGWFFDLF